MQLIRSRPMLSWFWVRLSPNVIFFICFPCLKHVFQLSFPCRYFSLDLQLLAFGPNAIIASQTISELRIYGSFCSYLYCLLRIFLNPVQEKLFSMLKAVAKSKPNVDVVKLQKSGGVVSRNAKYRQKSRGYRIRVSSTFTISGWILHLYIIIVPCLFH